MKAITCPQCGATIEHVSESSTIVDCEYCGARILMDRARPQISPPVNQDPPPKIYEVESSGNPIFKIIASLIAAAVLVPVFVGMIFLGKPKRPNSVGLAPTAKTTPYSPPPPIPPAWNASAEPTKPAPVVNYQPRVSWDGPNDMEYFADPDVDISSLSDLTSEEVKKTVFKDRTVRLRVVINTEGEIDQVETISGHPLLVAAATESAKRSIFRSRSKPTTRILTYTFRVLKD